MLKGEHTCGLKAQVRRLLAHKLREIHVKYD